MMKTTPGQQRKITGTQTDVEVVYTVVRWTQRKTTDLFPSLPVDTSLHHDKPVVE